MLETARHHWREGARHGFHRCCRARFIADRFRPALLSRVSPGLSTRLRQLTPRHTLADGVVPCEAHAAWWLLTGRGRARWRRELPAEICCPMRQSLERARLAELRQVALWGEVVESLDGEPLQLIPEGTRVWMLILSGDEELGISVTHCPWCGTELTS